MKPTRWILMAAVALVALPGCLYRGDGPRWRDGSDWSRHDDRWRDGGRDGGDWNDWRDRDWDRHHHHDDWDGRWAYRGWR